MWASLRLRVGWRTVAFVRFPIKLTAAQMRKLREDIEGMLREDTTQG